MLPSQALLREQKERVKLMRKQESELHERDIRIQTLEKSLGEARRQLKSIEGQGDKAAKQGRADREVRMRARRCLFCTCGGGARSNILLQ